MVSPTVESHPSPRSRTRHKLLLRILALVFGLTAALDALGESTLIPLGISRKDLVFDHSGNFLYITTPDGFVKRFNLASQQVDKTYNIGGSLLGIDIAMDDSFVLIAQAGYETGLGFVHRLDLG